MLYIVMIVETLAYNCGNIKYMKTFTNISDAIDTYNSLFTKCKEINDIDKTKCDDVNICETVDFCNYILKSVRLDETIDELDDE